MNTLSKPVIPHFELARKGKLIIANTINYRPVFLDADEKMPPIQATIGDMVDDEDGLLWKATIDGWACINP